MNNLLARDTFVKALHHPPVEDKEGNRASHIAISARCYVVAQR